LHTQNTKKTQSKAILKPKKGYNNETANA